MSQVSHNRDWESVRIKSVSKSAKYLSQLFISIIALMGFGPWASRKCRSISYSSVSNRISRSILPIGIVVCRDNTWARNRQNYLARLNVLEEDLGDKQLFGEFILSVIVYLVDKPSGHWNIRLCWRVSQVVELELKSYGERKPFELWSVRYNELQTELQQRI